MATLAITIRPPMIILAVSFSLKIIIPSATATTGFIYE